MEATRSISRVDAAESYDDRQLACVVRICAICQQPRYTRRTETPYRCFDCKDKIVEASA